MAAKVESAKFALNHGVHCILGNGHDQDILAKIFEGRSVGTLFTRHTGNAAAPHVRAMEARGASRELVALPSNDRRKILESVAAKINKQAEVILSANQDDLNSVAHGATDMLQGSAQRQRDKHSKNNMMLSKRKIKALSQAIESIALQVPLTLNPRDKP